VTKCWVVIRLTDNHPPGESTLRPSVLPIRTLWLRSASCGHRRRKSTIPVMSMPGKSALQVMRPYKAEHARNGESWSGMAGASLAWPPNPRQKSVTQLTSPKWPLRVPLRTTLLRKGGRTKMDFTEQVLVCVQCGSEFVFSPDEQRFFHEKQFTHTPKHCFKCRAARATGKPKRRQETSIICAECGQRAVVPFKPIHDKPALCRTCFEIQRGLIPDAIQLSSSSVE
jgi:CxxC-x17-CxxC domain-containing protein